MTTQRYNPITAAAIAAKPGAKAAAKAAKIALKSAWAEATSDDALIAYDRAAWAIAQRAVDDSIIAVTYTVWAVHAFGSLAFECGELFRHQIHEGYHANDPELLEGELVEEAPPEPKALPAGRARLAPAPRRRNQVEAIATAPIIPPFGLSTPDSIAPCQEAKYEYWMAKTKRQLQMACNTARIGFRPSERKHQLAKKLVCHRLQGVGIA